MRKVDNTDSLTYDSVMKTTPFVPAKSKVEAVARLYAAAQAPAEPLGPGGEEKKSVLTRTAERLALPVDDAAPKDVLARQILEELGKTWDSSFSSAGQTITLAGLNAILFVTEAELRLRATRKLRSEPPIFPSWFTPARNKLEAVRRLSSVTGGRPQDLGPGSKERKSVLIDLVTNLGLPLDTRLSKTRLAGAVAAMLGMPWTEACWSTGETITLEGLNAVLAGAEQRALRGPHGARYRIRQEARLLVTALGGSCPVHWDGRTCVKEMIANEYSKARQTEWVGWYFEFVGLPALVNAYGGGPVRVGVTEFDYAREFVWDLKTHAQKGLNSSCEVSGDTPLNDRESVSLSHQGSCQESCQRVMMTRAAAMIVVMVAGSRETCCKALKCLNMALALSAGARMADSRLLRVSSSGVGQGFFVGTRMPIPAPWYPLSARTGIPNQADRYRAGSTCSLAAVMSWVEPGSTGPVHTGNPV